MQEDDKIGCVVFGVEGWTPTCFKVCAIDNEENEYYIGIKGLFHSFRIPMFDIRIATEGRIKTHIENTGHLTHLVQRAIMKVRNGELFPSNKETEMKTIFDTIILALLAIFVTACGDAHNVNVNPDSGVPDGTVDECESVVSCDDPLADECGLECPDPVSFCNLGDPNRLIPNGCGFNNRGELEQRCIFSLEYEDYIWDDVECVDPDECEDGSIPTDYEPLAERLTTCGLNDRGHLALECVNGAWEDAAECIDPDDCVDGNETEPVPCGLNNRGQQISTCVEGSWVENDCIDPDECVDGDTRGPVVCGNSGLGTTNETCTSGEWVVGECAFDSHDDYYTEFGKFFYLDEYISSELSGYDEEALIASNYMTGSSSGQVTISFWINRVDGGIDADYMSFGAIYYLFGFTPVINAECSGPYGESGSCSTMDTADAFNVNDIGGGFHHMVFVIDFSFNSSQEIINIKVYLDKDLVSSNTHVIPILDPIVPNVLRLGENTIADYKHVAVFDHALSASEVRDLYNYGH